VSVSPPSLVQAIGRLPIERRNASPRYGGCMVREPTPVAGPPASPQPTPRARCIPGRRPDKVW
jgi:hypothetical protein